MDPVTLAALIAALEALIQASPAIMAEIQSMLNRNQQTAPPAQPPIAQQIADETRGDEAELNTPIKTS